VSEQNPRDVAAVLVVDDDAAFRAGANHQLTKPIDPQEVLTRILGHLSTVDLDRAPTVVEVGARIKTPDRPWTSDLGSSSTWLPR